MDNRGQAPVDKWFVGLFLMILLVIAWEFFSPLINTTLPTAFQTSANGYTDAITILTKNNFYIGCIALGLGYLFYTVFAPLIGQREDYPT
jgi:hypothetical protein